MAISSASRNIWRCINLKLMMTITDFVHQAGAFLLPRGEKCAAEGYKHWRRLFNLVGVTINFSGTCERVWRLNAVV